ncbi:MAG: L-iditol 2-dehydrogenase, partial [Chthoniobacterales bacterium]
TQFTLGVRFLFHATLVSGGSPMGLMSTMKLADKVAIVTGGASGIGKAIVKRFFDEGARMVVADRDAAAAEVLAKSLGAGSFSVPLDVTEQESIDRLVAVVADRAGGIDILVNCAAIYALTPITEVSRQQWSTVFSINVDGTFFTMQAVAKQMIKQGRGGKIINLASQAGRRGERLGAAYCATKAAVISLTQSAGLALIRHGINVNAIAPGIIDTPMWDVVDREFARLENLPVGEKKRQVSRQIPFGRMGRPEEVAGCAVFLASEDSDYVIAQTYGVDGGNWMA